jgi:hypothetical protein
VRLPAERLPHLKARLVAGPDVRLVDISRRGILLETDTRLLPGCPIRVKFVTDDATLILKGRVIRSSVAVVSGEGLVYRTGVSFDEDISVCDEATWTEAQAADGAGQPEEAPPAPGVDGHPETATPATATVTALFPAASEDLRSLLAANDW